MAWLAPCSTAAVASYARRIAKARRTSSVRFGLVLNAIVLWNTRYMSLALDELRNAGMQIQPDDFERLSPLVHHHIHLDGRYSFTLPEPFAHGELRPLRDPNDPAEQVFDLAAATA